jgi:hypothetical protein
MVLLVLLNRTRGGFLVGETDCGECNEWLVGAEANLGPSWKRMSVSARGV